MLTAEIALVAFQSDDEAIAKSLADVEPPYGTVDVVSAFGPSKIAACRLASRHLEPEADDAEDEFAPIILGSDIIELAHELEQPSRRRLLAFMLGFCRKAFDLGGDAAFAAACLELARLCAFEAKPAQPVALVTPAWLVLTGVDIAPETSVFLLSANRVRRTAIHPIGSPARFHAIERYSADHVVLVLADEPVMWSVTFPRGELRDVVRANDDDEFRALCLKSLAPVCPTVRARVRESALLAPAAPIKHDDPRQPIGAALEAALPTGDGRVFLRGWLRDPMHLVASAELRNPMGSIPVALDDLHRFRRPDVAKRFAGATFSDSDARQGFVAYLPFPSPGVANQSTLVLNLHGGTQIPVRSPVHGVDAAAARNAVLTSVPADDVTDHMLDACLGPAAAAFHQESFDNCPRAQLINIGLPPRCPHVSIVVPLYRNLSFLRFQMAAFAADPELQGAELIFVLDSPEQHRDVEHLLRGLHAVYKLSVSLLILTRNLGYAAANNAAAQSARAPLLLLLNSDVVPTGSAWLGRLLHAIERDGVAAAGPKLLFEDDSVQHAGLFFQRDLDGDWLNAHYHKGMPRRWPAANVSRNVPGVTGAALLVRKSDFETVGGICSDYIIGDYEDSDFCLRLRQTGKQITYVADAELYHFERRSISLHAGYAGTLACRLNRRLHHRRWNDVIAELMDRDQSQTAKGVL